MKVKGNENNEPIIPIFPSLQEGEYYDGMTLTPSNSTPIVDANKKNYWTHHLVPVEPNTTYIAVGGNRMWYYDANKQPILTKNILKEEPKFEFTTSSKTHYVSITYDPTNIEKGTEVLVKKKSLGDVNGDGEVNALDRTVLARYLAHWSGYDTINEVYSDVNLDGVVNQKDRMILARYLARWEGYETLPYVK